MGFDDAGLTVLLQARPSVAIRARGLDDGGDCRSDDARLILKKDLEKHDRTPPPQPSVIYGRARGYLRESSTYCVAIGYLFSAQILCVLRN